MKIIQILITASESQHLQDPDLALCWKDVYMWIEDWIQSEEEANFIFLDFLNLLREEGLGPVAPVAHGGILAYYSARGFRDQVINLIQQAEKRDWSQIHPQISIHGFKKPNGKIFYDGNGRISLLIFDDGCPSLTTGFILDWEHYHTPPLLGAKSPDFAVMLRFTGKYPGKYFDLKVYQDFVGKLEKRIRLLGDGWIFYHHLDDDQISQKHKGFPIHIRKPMLDLLRGTESSEDQVNRFMKANETILKEILACQEFWDMRQAFVEEAIQDG